MPTKLGQNFLKNNDIVRKIVEAADIKPDEQVLEIGPGKGVLTDALAQKTKKVVAVELDKNLVDYLKSKFRDKKNVKIIHSDILKTNLEEIVGSKFKVIANIPYYITSPIIRYLLENTWRPQELILMVQKEVAERIVAGPGSHSILSLSVQYYGTPEILFSVGKGNFDPTPDVDSAIIKISPFISRTVKTKSDKFFKMVRAGFCAKRKTLINNLSNSFHLDKKEVAEKIKTVGLKPTVRAQELNIEEWERIAHFF